MIHVLSIVNFFVVVSSSNAMDVDCVLEPVTGANNEMNNKPEASSDAEQPFSSEINAKEVLPETVSEVVTNSEPLNKTDTSTSLSLIADYDLNSNFQQRAKTKGTLKQQLHKKRQQFISSGVTTPSSDKSTDNSVKKIISPNHAKTQVLYVDEMNIVSCNYVENDCYVSLDLILNLNHFWILQSHYLYPSQVHITR